MEDKKKIITGEYTRNRKQRRNLAKLNMKNKGYKEICKLNRKGKDYIKGISLFAENWRRECYKYS